MTANPFSKSVMIASVAALLMGVAALAQSQPGTVNSTDNGQNQQPGAANSQGGEPADAQPGMSPTGEDAVDLQTLKDKAFVKEALMGGMTDVRLSQLAMEKSSSEDVKQFAQKIIADDTKLGADMTQVARANHIHPPADISDKEKALVTRLRGLSGAEFDDAYIRVMMRRSRRGDDFFKTEEDRSQVAAVKDAAEQNEPLIAGHLDNVRQLAAAHNVTGPKAKGPDTAATP